MTFATKLTVGRIALVPVFAGFALSYGRTVAAGAAEEWLRWTALGLFVGAAVTDALDGWIARRFNQRSRLGEILDPLADKLLLLTGVVVLSLVDWGPDGWRLPLWFALLVVARDVVILSGIAWLNSRRFVIEVRPHWTGKVCTFTQMFALAWVMLRVVPLPPLYPCLLAAVFIVWSMAEYVRAGLAILRRGERREE